MDRLVVVANPVASQFTGGSYRDVMATFAKTHEVEAVWPASGAEAARVAAEAVDSGARIVVAMGGDGIVHHVAQPLVGSDTILGIIPAGTTDVVARLLQVPRRPTTAARLIARTTEPLSLGVAEMTLARGDTETLHYALFACGLGLDAVVVERANREPYRKYRFGSLHYATTALGVALYGFSSTRAHMSVTAGVREARAAAVLLQFRDIYTYFGRLKLKLAKQEPDPMTALILERLRRHRVPQIAFNALFRRDLARVKGIEIWQRVQSLELTADPPVAAQADGESLGLVDGATIEWLPNALGVATGGVVT